MQQLSIFETQQTTINHVAIHVAISNIWTLSYYFIETS